MGNSVIQIRNIAKRYQLGAIGATRLRDDLERWFGKLRGGSSVPERVSSEFWALNDVSFDVQAGDVMGIIGRNGAGKSTLLKILSQITEPTRGEVRLRGRVASLLEVGTGFHPDLSGRDNIFLNGAILGMRKAEIAKKFDEIVAFAEVDQFIDTPVKRYSSGMYVRLAFAVAAHLDPEILIVDEVLAVGDAQFQKKCLGKMGNIRTEGTTILIVSHNMAVINNLCNRALLLDGGRVKLEARTAEVTQAYLSSDNGAGGQISWKDAQSAPGNGVARLASVRIVQEGSGEATPDVDISKDISVEIEYWNLKEGERLHAAIWLRDQHGGFVLATSSRRAVSLTLDDWDQIPRPVGLFRSVCRIPGNFLNEGLFSISALVSRDSDSAIQALQDYAVNFNVHDTGEMREEYFGHWLGTVRPKLAWSTDLLQANRAGDGVSIERRTAAK